ncbi:hypothetical protein D3C72_2160500 [compost metagenome]
MIAAPAIQAGVVAAAGMWKVVVTARAIRNAAAEHSPQSLSPRPDEDQQHEQDQGEATSHHELQQQFQVSSLRDFTASIVRSA